MRQSPQRQDTRTSPTPLVADILVYQDFNCAKDFPPGTPFPWDFGTPYQTIFLNSNIYPNHVLVWHEPIDSQGLWRRLWFAADRQFQEQYSYSLSYPYGGNTSYPRITYTFIVRRGEQPLQLGSPDPGNAVIGSFTYLQPLPSTDGYLQPSPSTFTYLQPAQSSSPAVLIAQSEEPLPTESGIGSVYVKQTRIYEIIPGSDDATPGTGSSQATTGYTVTRPLGTDTFFRLEWKIKLPRSVADNHRSTDYARCIIPGYENLILIQETIKADEDNNQESTIIRVYEGNITGAPFPSADKIVFQGKYYSGNMPPDKYVASKRKVVDTTITASPEDQDVSSPSDAPVSTPLPKYSRIDNVEVKPDGESPNLVGTKSVTYYTDVEIQTLYGQQWDNNIRDYVPYYTYVIPTEEYANIGDPAPGTQRDVTPIGTGWLVVTVQTPRETDIEVLTSPFAVDGTARSYLDVINDSWPNVLYGLTIIASPDGDQLAVDHEFRPRAYNGPCVCCKQVAWKKNSPNVIVEPNLQMEFFDPSSLTIQWPGVISFSIPECLHYNPEAITGLPVGTYVFTGPTGTNYYKQWLPTNFATWPSQYVKLVSVEPYLGGFRIEKITVQKPNIPTYA